MSEDTRRQLWLPKQRLRVKTSLNEAGESASWRGAQGSPATDSPYQQVVRSPHAATTADDMGASGVSPASNVKHKMEAPHNVEGDWRPEVPMRKRPKR